MTAELAPKEASEEDTAGASFHGITDWHAIDWRAVNSNVRRLQARIVKATKEKRWGKVKALQRLLTHSFSGKASGRATSDGKPRQEHPRSGPGPLEHSTEKAERDILAAATGLPSPTAAPGLHPEEKRQKERFRYSRDEVPSDAGLVFAGTEPGSGNDSRPSFLRFSARTVHR